MAYPPAALSTNATDGASPTDTTPTAVLTAAEVNATNAAVNDVVAELGANPSGAAASVAARLDGVDSAIAGLSGTYAPLAPDWATGEVYVAGQMVVDAGTLYRCTTAHTAGGSFAAGNFAALGGGGGGGTIADGSVTTAKLAANAVTAAKVAADVATQAELDAVSAAKANASHTHSAADLTSGTLGLARGGTGGTDAASARTSLGLGTAATVNTGTTSGTVPTLGASGTLAVARLATGTPDGTKFIRDDGVLAVPAGGGVPVYSRGFTVQQPAPGTGQYLAGRIPGNATGQGMNAGMANGSAFAVPFMASAGFTANKIGCGAHLNGSAGALIRLGIYADDGGFYPGSLILDAGTVDGTAMAPTATITISQAISAYTIYWLVLAYQGSPATTPNIKASGNAGSPVTSNLGLGSTSLDTLCNASDPWFKVTGVTGALPSTFPARSAIAASVNAPVVALGVQ